MITMVCDNPQCTSRHANRGPAKDRCPAAQVRRRAAQARYKRTAKGILTDMRYNSTQRKSQ